MRKDVGTVWRPTYGARGKVVVRAILFVAVVLAAIALGYGYFFYRAEQSGKTIVLLEPVWVQRGEVITDPSGQISIRYDTLRAPVLVRFLLDTGEEEPVPLMLKEGESGSFLYKGNEYFLRLLSLDEERGAQISIERES